MRRRAEFSDTLAAEHGNRFPAALRGLIWRQSFGSKVEAMHNVQWVTWPWRSHLTLGFKTVSLRYHLGVLTDQHLVHGVADHCSTLEDCASYDRRSPLAVITTIFNIDTQIVRSNLARGRSGLLRLCRLAGTPQRSFFVRSGLSLGSKHSFEQTCNTGCV